MPEHAVPATLSGADPDWLLDADRQLHLVDQVIGLRSQLAEEIVRGQMRLAGVTAERDTALAQLHLVRLADAELRTELAAAARELDLVRESRTWRVGLLVTKPARGLRRLVRRR